MWECQLLEFDRCAARRSDDVMQRLAAMLIICQVTSAAWAQSRDDPYFVRQCEHAGRMQEYKLEDLTHALDAYRQCLAGAPQFSCGHYFGAIASARDDLQQAIDAVESQCVLLGRRPAPIPQP
jgi:hypothetical protein